MTPSQSKMNTSVLSRICCAGELSFRTLAFRAVLRRGPDRDTKARVDGVKADAVDATKELNARLVHFIVVLVCVKEAEVVVSNAVWSGVAVLLLSFRPLSCCLKRVTSLFLMTWETRRLFLPPPLRHYWISLGTVLCIQVFKTIVQDIHDILLLLWLVCGTQ